MGRKLFKKTRWRKINLWIPSFPFPWISFPASLEKLPLSFDLFQHIAVVLNEAALRPEGGRTRRGVRAVEIATSSRASPGPRRPSTRARRMVQSREAGAGARRNRPCARPPRGRGRNGYKDILAFLDPDRRGGGAELLRRLVGKAHEARLIGVDVSAPPAGKEAESEAAVTRMFYETTR